MKKSWYLYGLILQEENVAGVTSSWYESCDCDALLGLASVCAIVSAHHVAQMLGADSDVCNLMAPLECVLALSSGSVSP